MSPEARQLLLDVDVERCREVALKLGRKMLKHLSNKKNVFDIRELIVTASMLVMGVVATCPSGLAPDEHGELIKEILNAHIDMAVFAIEGPEEGTLLS